MVIVAQLVRASDCGSEGRGFETRLSPKKSSVLKTFFVCSFFDFVTINRNKLTFEKNFITV
jgi:hypothetical protein